MPAGTRTLSPTLTACTEKARAAPVRALREAGWATWPPRKGVPAARRRVRCMVSLGRAVPGDQAVRVGVGGWNNSQGEECVENGWLRVEETGQASVLQTTTAARTARSARGAGMHQGLPRHRCLQVERFTLHSRAGP